MYINNQKSPKKHAIYVRNQEFDDVPPYVYVSYFPGFQGILWYIHIRHLWLRVAILHQLDWKSFGQILHCVDSASRNCDIVFFKSR